MIKTALVSIALLVLPASAFAASTADVQINNHVSSSSNNSNSQVNSHTDVTVETNGNTTHYSSDEPGSIEVHSNNGVTEIKKNGNVVTGNDSNNPTTTPTASPTAKPTPKPDDNNETNKNIFKAIEELFKKLFSVFG